MENVLTDIPETSVSGRRDHEDFGLCEHHCGSIAYLHTICIPNSNGTFEHLINHVIELKMYWN